MEHLEPFLGHQLQAPLLATPEASMLSLLMFWPELLVLLQLPEDIYTLLLPEASSSLKPMAILHLLPGMTLQSDSSLWLASLTPSPHEQMPVSEMQQHY
jgi:hypothetical protein